MSVKTFYYYTATSIRQSYSYVYILIKFAVYHGTTPWYNTAVRRLNTAVQDFPRYPTLMHTHVSCTQMINVTRPDLERPWDTHFVYYMTFHGALVPAATAVDLASLLHDHEVAILLGFVVVSKATGTGLKARSHRHRETRNEIPETYRPIKNQQLAEFISRNEKTWRFSISDSVPIFWQRGQILTSRHEVQ